MSKVAGISYPLSPRTLPSHPDAGAEAIWAGRPAPATGAMFTTDRIGPARCYIEPVRPGGQRVTAHPRAPACTRASADRGQRPAIRQAQPAEPRVAHLPALVRLERLLVLDRHPSPEPNE